MGDKRPGQGKAKGSVYEAKRDIQTIQAEPAPVADRAGMSAFRVMKSTRLARLLSCVIIRPAGGAVSASAVALANDVSEAW